MKLVHRVYEGFVDGERFVFSVNAVREVSLREEIRNKERIMKIGRMIFETDDRNKARNYTEKVNGQVIEL